MEWSKKKSTIAVVITALLLGGLALVTREIIHAIRVAHYPNIAGTWEGVAHLEDAGITNGEAARTRVVLKLFKTRGVYRATTDWIDLGKKDVPMGDVVYDFPKLEITQNVSRRNIWELMVNARATDLSWDHHIHFIQPDPVVFKRTTTPDSVPEPLTEGDFLPGAGTDLQGYWEGAIGTGPDAVPMDLKIARQSDGTYRGEGDIPGQGIQGRPIIVSYNPPLVKIGPADGAGIFSGQLNEAGTEISGSLTQGGQSIPAVVRRADYQAEHAHDADKDYSFTSKIDLQGHWKGTWIAVFDGGKIKIPIRLGLDIAKLPDGSYSAALLNLDEFGAEAPIPTSDFDYSPPDLRLAWKWNDDTRYEGKLAGGKIVGTWYEGGGGFSLIFER